MIRFKDSLVIASAKFRSQKRKTVLTIVVSGVLFGFLLGTLIVSKSALSSVEAFSNKVLDGRQLVLATKVDTSNEQLISDQSLIKKAEDEFRVDISKKQEYARIIGYNYDASQEPPVVTVDAGDPATKRLNLANPIAKRIIEEAKKTLSSDTQELQGAARKYNYRAIYTLKSLNPIDGTVKQTDTPVSSGDKSEVFGGGQVPYIVDDSILQPYMSTDDRMNGAIPIVIPFSTAEAKLGLSRLPSAASSKEKTQRMKEVREKATKTTFRVCYRNDISRVLLEQSTLDATSQLEKYGVIYGKPKDYCSDPQVVQDTRTALQKSNEKKQNNFKSHFGEEATTRQKSFTFKVIGVTPDSLEGASKDNLSQVFLSSLSPPGFGFSAIPASAIAKFSDEFSGIFAQSETASDALPMKQYLIEFTGSDKIARFLKENQCDPSIGCSGSGFTYTQFGSSSVQLKNMSETLGKVYLYAIAVFGFIAVIVLGGTFSKIVADSRRETAVFRALGGKRLDIVKIYLTYSLVLSMLTIVFTAGLGYLLSFIVHSLYAEQLFVELQATYGIVGGVYGAPLVSFVPGEIVLMTILIIASAALSMGLSLIGNLGRSITSDLRTE